MADIGHIDDHFESTVEPRILEQYKDSERWKECVKAVIDQMQVAEDATFELSRVLDFRSEIPESGRLDFIASLLNLERFSGESDRDFFNRLIFRTSKKNAGTPDNVIYNASILSGDPAPQYMDEAPATFFVYTPGGRQLKKKEVQKMAPCGVLGLPGAAIRFADGSVMGDYDGRKMLAVADDESRERYVTVNVIAADGRYIVDAEGRRIIAVMKIK